MLGIGYVILLWHSLSLPYDYSIKNVQRYPVKLKKAVQSVPRASSLNMRKGAPLDLTSEDSYDSDSDHFNDDDELCCV